jgi:molecular chaperone GrpE
MSQSRYDPYRRGRQSRRSKTLSETELKQLEATFQKLEREAAGWEERARVLEKAAAQAQTEAEQCEIKAKELSIAAAKAQEQAAEWEAKAKGLLAEVAESEEQSTDWEHALQAGQEEAAEMRDRLARAQADYQNTKQRLERRVALQAEEKTMDFIRDLLPVLDNLDRAITMAQPADAACAGLREGVGLTRRTFADALAKHGVTPIAAVGEPFDPNVHEAIGTLPDAGSPPGTVVEVAEKGYAYGDRLLRPARVLITELG